VTPSAPEPVSVVIPTYRRERVLLDSIEALLALERPPAQVVVVDQTRRHEAATAERLARLHDDGRIEWARLSAPSIPRAMNHGARRATSPIVLFLDDDIVPASALVSAHARAHARGDGDLVAGRVLQPWDVDGATPDLDRNPFASTVAHGRRDFMGGNFSMRRERFLELGGIDENFVRVAYRFEAEFAHRLLARGGTIRFEPEAEIRHLKATSGGTRSYGEHLRTALPSHSVGEYYYLLRSRAAGRWRRLLLRPLRAVCTRAHARRPWWIPVTLVAEELGFAWAVLLALRGPRVARHAA
jgi:GT2 family glycosyltransferase